MTWRQAPGGGTPAPPKGYERALLRANDSLASLERELGVKAEVIAEANGVPWPGRKTCAWSRDIRDWVLKTGGHENAFDPKQPDNCAPGHGFVSFSVGQAINLPRGARAPAVDGVPPSKPKPKSNTGLIVGALALLAAGAAAFAGQPAK